MIRMDHPMMEFDRQKLLQYPFLMKHKAELKKKLLGKNHLQDVRIAVLCGSTFGTIQDFLELFLLLNGLRPTFWVGAYDRVYEEACFEEPALRAFQPEILLVHTSNQNLSCVFGQTDEKSLHREKARHEQIWTGIREIYGCTIIQNNYAYFPYRVIGNAARWDQEGNVRFINELNQFLDEYAANSKDFYVNDIQYLSALYGIRNWNDQRMWDLYKYAMSMQVMPAYANNLANLIKAMFGKNKKLIVTDLDNTLWGGVIGDDGLDHIQMGSGSARGASYSRLQSYLKTLSRSGILLGICSKNERKTALEGIRCKNCLLDEDDFVSSKINWAPKSENIRKILSELNLLEDSAVFLDDNPAELLEVANTYPNMEAILAEKAEDVLDELESRSYFEVTGRTEEDRRRLGYYQSEKKRMEERQNYKDYDEYLRSLRMTCYVDRIHLGNLERVTQLFNKTNQFNFLMIRYTQEELEQLCKRDDIRSFVLELDDRFGANGIVSAALLKLRADHAEILGWVMSCRVFKRGLEFVMLHLMCEQVLLEGKHILRGYYCKSKKNQQLCDFFPQTGFSEIKSDSEGHRTAYECADLNGLMALCEKHQIKVVKKDGM